MTDDGTVGKHERYDVSDEQCGATKPGFYAPGEYRPVCMFQRGHTGRHGSLPFNPDVAGRPTCTERGPADPSTTEEAP